MQLSTTIQGKSFTQTICRYAWLICLLPILLSGCGSKEATYQYNISGQRGESFRPHDSGFTVNDIPASTLTPEQEEIFEKYTELEHELSREQMITIADYFQFYLGNTVTISTFYARSLPYLGYTMNVFEERNLPVDLAYMAFLESGYNTNARSSAGASGMWQFMPRTGDAFDLPQDWFGDWRNDPYMATHAAADYLEYLYDYFDDWFLGISAYNAGEGKIGNALEGTGATNLHELVMRNHMLNSSDALRDETLEFVPRFVALKKVMMYADELGFEPMHDEIPNIDPNIYSSLINPGTDLLTLANLMDMSWEEFQSYNLALNSYISPTDRSIYIHMPTSKKSAFERAVLELHEMDEDELEGIYLYTVRPGDSYSALASVLGMPSYILSQLNASQSLTVGEEIYIPQLVGRTLPTRITSPYVEPVGNTSSTVTIAHQTHHTVQSGDTLNAIANTYGVTLNELYQHNEGINPNALRIGSRIMLPPPPTLDHVVQSGDTLWGIARHYNTTVDTLNYLNNLNSTNLRIGQVIMVPYN